jgi:hypothetical protein
MKIEFDWPDTVPKDQINIEFIQGMLDRMAVGFYNYGHMRRQHNRPDNLRCKELRIDKYKETKNTEYLMDDANYSMMEFTVPSLEGAFFKTTEKHESPGAVVDGRLVKGKEDYIAGKQYRKEGD